MSNPTIHGMRGEEACILALALLDPLLAAEEEKRRAVLMAEKYAVPLVDTNQLMEYAEGMAAPVPATDRGDPPKPVADKVRLTFDFALFLGPICLGLLIIVVRALAELVAGSQGAGTILDNLHDDITPKVITSWLLFRVMLRMAELDWWLFRPVLRRWSRDR